jgi:hypothetical protein
MLSRDNGIGEGRDRILSMKTPMGLVELGEAIGSKVAVSRLKMCRMFLYYPPRLEPSEELDQRIWEMVGPFLSSRVFPEFRT